MIRIKRLITSKVCSVKIRRKVNCILGKVYVKREFRWNFQIASIFSHYSQAMVICYPFQTWMQSTFICKVIPSERFGLLRNLLIHEMSINCTKNIDASDSLHKRDLWLIWTITLVYSWWKKYSTEIYWTSSKWIMKTIELS